MVSAVVLVAGFSKRMGKLNKLSLPFRGSTILQTTLESILNSNFDEVVVVTSKMSFNLTMDSIKKIKHDYIKCVVNVDPGKGMTSSIQEGIKALSNESKNVFICLADMPTIQSETYNELIENLLICNYAIIQPYFKGKKGNPVGFKSSYYSDILKLENSNGCAQVLKTNSSNVLKYECPDSSILVDIDDQASYQRLLKDEINSLTDK